MKRVSLILLHLFLFFTGSARALADDAAVPEYAMKAAYLYNFAQLTDWPIQGGVSDDGFNLCVFGQEELIAALESLRGRLINGHQLRVVRIADVADARHCHLMYVSDSDSTRGIRLLESLRGAPVLTVSDDQRAVRYGAMLMIVPEQHRLTFEINLDAARRSQMKFSSKLLRLAKKVNGE